MQKSKETGVNYMLTVVMSAVALLSGYITIIESSSYAAFKKDTVEPFVGVMKQPVALPLWLIVALLISISYTTLRLLPTLRRTKRRYEREIASIREDFTHQASQSNSHYERMLDSAARSISSLNKGVHERDRSIKSLQDELVKLKSKTIQKVTVKRTTRDSFSFLKDEFVKTLYREGNSDDAISKIKNHYGSEFFEVVSEHLKCIGLIEAGQYKGIDQRYVLTMAGVNRARSLIKKEKNTKPKF